MSRRYRKAWFNMCIVCYSQTANYEFRQPLSPYTHCVHVSHGYMGSTAKCRLWANRRENLLVQDYFLLVCHCLAKESDRRTWSGNRTHRANVEPTDGSVFSNTKSHVQDITHTQDSLCWEYCPTSSIDLCLLTQNDIKYHLNILWSNNFWNYVEIKIFEVVQRR